MYVVQPIIRVGDRPGRGTWRCLDCNWRVTIKEEDERLPPCGGDCKKSEKVDENRAHYTRLRGLV